MAIPKEVLVKSLPNKTGVYIMKNGKGKTIYVGKAKNIRNRVNSYFNKSGDNRYQTGYLVKEIKSIDYLITKDEREALLLENSLIKNQRPKFNIRLKDDKTYASLCLTVKEKFPKLIFTRRPKDDGSVYYGPFSSAGALKQTKKIVHKLFPIRDCTNEKFKRHWDRPCLNYNLKLCSGPCASKISEESYREIVNQTRSFLTGNKRQLLKILKDNMRKASDEMRYEDAAYQRDQIFLLEKNIEVDKHINSDKKDKDVVGFNRDNGIYEFVVLFFRNGSVVDKAEYSIKNFAAEESQVLREFIGRFYQTGRYIPSEILLQLKMEDKGLYENFLSEKRGKKVKILVPNRGSKLKLLKLAINNSKENFKIRQKEKLNEQNLLKSLKKSLSLKKLPERIECFDISNIQGSNPVASLVRFKGGKPDRNMYRRYKVKTVEGPNDYASMHEILSRRFKRANQDGWELPELIMIDGGKGQLNIAHSAVKDLGYEKKVELISIAKGRARGELDKIYLHGKRSPYILRNNLSGLHLLMRIRDEAHRVAIDFHKKLRGKRLVKSSLDNIPGVGEKRKAILLKHFGSLSAIKKAGIDEIASLRGMNIKVAKIVKENLN